MNRDRAQSVDDGADPEMAFQTGAKWFAHALGETTDDTDVGPAEAWVAALETIQSQQEQIEALQRQVTDNSQQLDRLGNIGEEPTTKEQKIVAVLQYAENIRNPNESKVVVKPKDIKGATGVSRRYAYDLVDEMHDSYEWATDNTRREARTTGLSGAESDSPPCGVLIDFDEVAHATDGVVNKFTTRNTAEEAAD
jgi:hypothetical protein